MTIVRRFHHTPHHLPRLGLRPCSPTTCALDQGSSFPFCPAMRNLCHPEDNSHSGLLEPQHPWLSTPWSQYRPQALRRVDLQLPPPSGKTAGSFYIKRVVHHDLVAPHFSLLIPKNRVARHPLPRQNRSGSSEPDHAPHHAPVIFGAAIAPKIPNPTVTRRLPEPPESAPPACAYPLSSAGRDQSPPALPRSAPSPAARVSPSLHPSFRAGRCLRPSFAPAHLPHMQSLL